MEEQLRQAEEALASARAEKEQASSELKAAQENAVPTKQLEHPPGDAGMQLSSEDITDLTDMLKQCGLLAVAAAEEAGEPPSKKARAGPHSNPKKSPREIAKLANPALIARLASSVHFLEEAVKSGGDGSLEDTIPGDPEALREPLAPPPANPKDTVKDTETPQMPKCTGMAQHPSKTPSGSLPLVAVSCSLFLFVFPGKQDRAQNNTARDGSSLGLPRGVTKQQRTRQR